MLKIYIKTAWRNLLYHRVNSLLNLSGLTIGMTAAFLIFMWVKNEFSYDAYHPDASNIYRLTTLYKKDAAKGDERIPYLLGEDIKKQVPGVQITARLYPLTVFTPTVKIDQRLFKEKAAAYVDEGWFKIFQFDFAQGSAEGFNSMPNSVVISTSNAKKYFGDDNPIGKTIRVGKKYCIVQGVVKDYPSNSSFKYNMFISNAVRDVNPNLRQHMAWPDSYQTFIRLVPSTSTASVLNKINSTADEGWKKNYTIGLISLTDIHFEVLGNSFLQHGDRQSTTILLLLGILLLSIACINYVNLTTAKASVRIREVSVKKILGAERKHLFLQFMTESFMINLIALTVTLILVWISLPIFNSFTDNHFILSLADPSLWQLLAGTSICTLLLAGIYPALLLSSFKPIAMLGGGQNWPFRGGKLRKSLVIVQFSISITLLIATVIIYKQMQFINHQYDHYDKSRLFSFMFQSSLNDDEKRMQMENIKRQLLEYSAIENVAIMGGNEIINLSNRWDGFDWEGRSPDIDYKLNFIPIGSNFNEIAKLQLKEGRWFLANTHNDDKNFILNETAAKELGIHQPVIGQKFILDNDTGAVIGVVKDFHYLGLHSKIEPLVFGNNPSYANSFMVKSMPGKQAEALVITEKIMKEFQWDVPFDYHFASDQYEQLYHVENKTASLIWSSSILAVFISCLGLYGLAAFSTERRNKEIGIRKVLGASVTGIVQMLSSDFLKLVFIAIVIAFPISWWFMSIWLQNFVYRIDIQWWMFALTGSVAVCIAFLTICTQAVKAAMSNPVKSLRTE